MLKEAKKIVVNNINQTIVLTYFEIGRMIIENEQKGKERAEYGKAVLKELSKRLTSEFGKGYSVYNLERMRKLYLTYKDRIKPDEKSATLLRKSEKIFKLSWSHYLLLLKIDNPDERNFYEIEAATNNWSYRELERQYNSSLYERLVLSMEKKTIKELSEKGQIISKSTDAVKDPYVLDFLDLEEQKQYTESDLETAIINKLEHFLLELGKGFLFVGR
ncbi:MAG: PDDEXK nuclease domain-containing protein, partial [Cyclobacteriaceae bacterium]